MDGTSIISNAWHQSFPFIPPWAAWMCEIVSWKIDMEIHKDKQIAIFDCYFTVLI